MPQDPQAFMERKQAEKETQLQIWVISFRKGKRILQKTEPEAQRVEVKDTENL